MNPNPARSMPAGALQETSSGHHAVAVIGIGSAFDDDQAGWLVIDRLAQLGMHECDLRKASVPHDIIDWLSPSTVVHLVDACQDPQPTVRRFQIAIATATGSLEAIAEPQDSLPSNWPFTQVRSNSTHQFSLLDTLGLAAALGQLPLNLVLWTIAIQDSPRTDMLHPATAARIDLCVSRIFKELRHA